jgi:hypothetical protein
MAQTTVKHRPATKGRAIKAPASRASATKASATKAPATKATATKATATKAAATKASATKNGTTPKRALSGARSTKAVDRTAKLSHDVLESVESGQRAAIDAVRNFVDTLDHAVPAHGAGVSKRQDVFDSAMQMADRLVHTQYDFMRKVIASAGTSLTKSGGKS